MTSLRHTALGLALGLAFAANAMAVTTIPFWHSMEGSWVKKLTPAQRFNDTHPDYKIVPVYKGNYEQSLSAGIAAFRTGNAPALLQVYEVGTATMMASKPSSRCTRCSKRRALTLTSPSLCQPWRDTIRIPKAGIYCPSRLTAPRRCCTTTKTPSGKPV